MKSLAMIFIFLVPFSGVAIAQTDWVAYEGNPVIEGDNPDDWSPGEWDDGDRWVYEVIEVDGIGYDDLTAQRAAVVSAAEATGRLGHG